MLKKKKIPGGKLICLEVEFSGRQLSSFKLTGDFFMHPEERIQDVEEFFSVVTFPLDKIGLEELFKKNFSDLIITGFTCADILDLLGECYDEAKSYKMPNI